MSLILPDWFRALPEKEQGRLVQDATAPLTPAELEQKLENKGKAHLVQEVREAAQQIATTRMRFCEEAVKAQVDKGLIPAHVLRGGPAAKEWLQTNGFHFKLFHGRPLYMEFCRGDYVLARMEIQLCPGVKA